MDKQKKVSQLISKNYQLDIKGAFVSGQFIKQGKINSPRFLYGFHNHIVICKDPKKPQKSINLAFENKFEIIRLQVEDKKQIGKPTGIKFELEGTKHQIQFLCDNTELIKKFRDYLSQRINQRCFHESFKAHKKIGKGNFASVYLADRLEDQKPFAIKAFSKEVAYGQDKGKYAIKNEIELMRQLDCQSLIKLHEVYETENSLYMVLDLLEGGSLYDKIKHRPTFNHKEIELLMRSLMQGLAAMHVKRIMHRDLKPENILFRKLNQVETVCIADFGLATNADLEYYLFIRCGTPGFVAPEVVNCKDTNVHYEPVCDVFSLGLIFYILLTGKPAFPGKSYNDVLVKNRRCEIILAGDLFDNIPSISRDLLEKMLQREPSKRITSMQAVKHAYFTQIINFQKTVSNVEDAINENDEGEGSLGANFMRIHEEAIKFDMARINQLQNSPINSPIITASSRLKEKNASLDHLLFMNTPLLNGKIDSIQGSPEQTQFNSPSGSPTNVQYLAQLRRPSKFKDSTDNERVDSPDNETDQSQQQMKNSAKLGSNPNNLHKYAIQQQMHKSSQEEQKQTGQVSNVKNQLKKLQ